MNNEDEKKSFVVKDNRRFDSQGNEKSLEEKINDPLKNKIKSEAKVSRVITPLARDNLAENRLIDDNPEELSSTKHQINKEEFGQQGEYTGEISFGSFVISLGTQALMQLGVMPAPDGVKLPPDREAAKQTIEILAMLAEKTKGNLEAEEERLINDILHNLRLGFLKG
jgi:hypothetical protein